MSDGGPSTVALSMEMMGDSEESDDDADVIPI
jgi:hypothetical protein